MPRCAALQEFLVLLSPYAPHLAEELWTRAGASGSISTAPWPVADESLLVVDSVKLPVQVRGRGCDLRWEYACI